MTINGFEAIDIYKLMKDPETIRLLKCALALLSGTHQKTSEEMFGLLQKLRAIESKHSGTVLGTTEGKERE